MNRKFCMGLLCFILTNHCMAQRFYFHKVDANDSIIINKQMPALATEVLLRYKNRGDKETYFNNLFRLQITAGKYADAQVTINSLRSVSKSDYPQFASLQYIQYELFARAKLMQAASFKTTFSELFNRLYGSLDDKSALYISTAFITRNGIDALKNDFQNSFIKAQQKDSLDMDNAITLCSNYGLWQVFKSIEPIARPLLKDDDSHRYIIQDSVYIKTKDGATLSAVVVRKRGVNIPQPAALLFFIYSNTDRSLSEAKYSAAHGYVGVVADTRGKRLSPDVVEPYEHEAKDVNEVIDWISKQAWSNGKVGMYGGSYSGFAQWAATKYMNSALKTIVPYVAAIPGQGLPMENNVFLNANYQWAFYVTNNKYVDNVVNSDNQRWRRMNNSWYESGAAYRKIDSVDGTPNPWLQRWLKHPDYDSYWQNMVPYKTDFAKINIPVLSITGYYDDGQISAMQYLTEHYKYNPKAEHYLIIGPYDHFGAQQGGTPVLRDYTVDPVALIHTKEITFEWLDYILKGDKKPAILQDKINYELMGANVWRHAPSIAKMSSRSLKLYLTNIKLGGNYRMTEKKPVKPGSLHQEVDLADRKTSNNDYYPDPIIKKQLDRSNGLFFISKPFDHAVSLNGMFAGELKAMINKKDMDIGVVLYEVMPNGEYFELSYFLGRASYVSDMSRRKLLRPGVLETIPFTRTRLVSRQLSKGSRLLVVLNIDKNPFAQINYGTGKDVSDETIKDGKVPLKIKWHNDSFIKIPIQ